MLQHLQCLNHAHEKHAHLKLHLATPIPFPVHSNHLPPPTPEITHMENERVAAKQRKMLVFQNEGTRR